MKVILSFFIVLTTHLAASQNSGINIELASNPGVAINGQTIDIISTSNELTAYLKIVNISNDDNNYYWQRDYCGSAPAFELEQLCDNWSCVELPLDNHIWTISQPRPIAEGENSVFEPKVVFPNNQCDSALICYYILDSNLLAVDSIKIHFFYLNPDICPQLVDLSNEPVELIHLYPNPTSGVFNLTNATSGSSVEFTNMLGKVVLKKSLNGTVQSFNLSSQPDGVYFYTIKSADGLSTSTKRLVLRK